MNTSCLPSWRIAMQSRDEMMTSPMKALIEKLPDVAMLVMDRCVHKSNKNTQSSSNYVSMCSLFKIPKIIPTRELAIRSMMQLIRLIWIASLHAPNEHVKTIYPMFVNNCFYIQSLHSSFFNQLCVCVCVLCVCVRVRTHAHVFVDVGSRTIYDYFIKALQQTYDLQVRDGQNYYDFTDKELKEIFVRPRITILIRKQREFQFKLLHGAIYTNEHLHRFGFVGDNLCSFCKQEIETYTHLFFSCGSVQRIWQALIQILELDEIKYLEWRDIFVGLVGSSYRIKFVILSFSW